MPLRLFRNPDQLPQPHEWHRWHWNANWRAAPIAVLASVGSVIFTAWVAWVLATVIRGQPPVFWGHRFSPIPNCAPGSRISTECGATLGFATSVLTLAFTTAVFLYLRTRLALLQFRRRAKRHTVDFVPTAANSIIDTIVGRDPLCLILKRNLRKQKAGQVKGRPHLLVGGVGAGKTAVLVRLTKLLAHHAAVPVPLRLRDVQNCDLDFDKLARERFCRDVDELLLRNWLFTAASAEKIWRWLRKQNRIVVLADGLEEAFVSGDKHDNRDNLIREAISEAGRLDLPLIIASRPHVPLRSVEAAIVELEPLNEEAALSYIQRDGSKEDEQRLDWIVEWGEVTETPLYLQLTKQLHERRLLHHVVGRTEDSKLDTRLIDRPGLRRRLLSTWIEGIISGEIHSELALTKDERRASVAHLGALACVGIQADSIEVGFDELLRHGTEPGGPPILWTELRNQVPNRSINLPLATTWAEQLGLVEAHDNRARFQHSLMEAYLASRFLEHADADLVKVFWRHGLGNARGPSPEFLIALVFAARRHREVDDHRDQRLAEYYSFEVMDDLLDAADWLMGLGGMPGTDARGHEEAKDLRKGDKVLDIYGTALEIDAAWGGWRHSAPQEVLTGSGAMAASGNADTLQNDHRAPPDTATQRTRARPGGNAVRHLANEIEENWQNIHSDDLQGLRTAKERLAHRFGLVLRDLESQRERHVPDRQDTGQRSRVPASGRFGYSELYRIGEIEDRSYGVRLAAAEEIGLGGDAAYISLHGTHLEEEWNEYERRERQAEKDELLAHRRRVDDQSRTVADVPSPRHPAVSGETESRQHKWERAHDVIMSAWIAPLLLGSITDESLRQDAENHLCQWLDHVDPVQRRERSPELPLTLEIALSQGFKAAANRRRRHPATSPEAHAILVERAEQLLTCSQSWYAQLTLIQALTLWALPDEDGEDSRQAEWQRTTKKRQVDRWLTMARTRPNAYGEAPGEEPVHPFVEEAAKLAKKALATGEPQKYVWIDESGVVNKVGSLESDHTHRRYHNLWIPPSTGWSALAPRAQRLVGEVLLLLNLAERGGLPAEQERYLQRANRSFLPPCITRDHRPLRPDLSVANRGTDAPGSSCLNDCAFELCPYPARGTPQRTDPGESYCRSRANRASWPRLGRPGGGARNARTFWARMADRRSVRRWIGSAD